MFTTELLSGVVVFGILVVGPLFVVVVVVWEKIDQHKDQREKLRKAEEYRQREVESTRGRGESRQPTSVRDYDDGPLKSTRQLQHEWYEGHSELNWQDREIAEMYGMDVDTYINNFKEAD